MHFLYALRSSLPEESKKLQQACQLYRWAENEEGLFRQEGKQIVPINRDLRWKYGIKQGILRVYFRAAI